MKRIAGIGAAVVVVAAFVLGAARADDLSQAVVLVASEKLDDSPFEQVVAAPLADGGHIGFIVNRPTTVKLEKLFPNQPPARNVNEPIYVGGPILPRAVFALMPNAPDGAGTAIALIKLWEVRPADAQTILPARSHGLWNSLRSPMAAADGYERSRLG